MNIFFIDFILWTTSKSNYCSRWGNESSHAHSRDVQYATKSPCAAIKILFIYAYDISDKIQTTGRRDDGTIVNERKII